MEPNLISLLYEQPFTRLDKTRDTRFGMGRCSPDFRLFDKRCSTIKQVARDLTDIMKASVQSDVLVTDSFFNIYAADCGITPHNHLSTMDSMVALGLGKQKYSLVYYLEIGDQDCEQPGFLRFHGPEDNVLPSNGMYVIFPAAREHSACYSGSRDRVLIGANFYKL